MLKRKETHMSATALNRMIRKIVGAENMSTVKTLIFAKASKSMDPVQYSKKHDTVVINCPTNTLTIGGSFPDLLDGMVNLKRISKNIGIEIDHYIRSSQKEPIKDEVYPDNASLMYSTSTKEDIVQTQANQVINIDGISSRITVDKMDGSTFLEVQIICHEFGFPAYTMKFPIQVRPIVDGVTIQRNKYTQIVKGFHGMDERVCCTVSMIEKNILFISILTPTLVSSFAGKLVLKDSKFEFENVWDAKEKRS